MLTETYRLEPDADFLDMIDRAFHQGQINGETMELIYLWLEGLGCLTPLLNDERGVTARR